MQSKIGITREVGMAIGSLRAVNPSNKDNCLNRIKNIYYTNVKILIKYKKQTSI